MLAALRLNLKPVLWINSKLENAYTDNANKSIFSN